MSVRLFKNVDIRDLESILEKGILSLNESENINWESGKRAKNSKEVVYLFKPIGENNSFPDYGIALLEVDAKAELNKIGDNDYYKGIYKEYITNKVPSENILNIYIPKIFKNRIELEQALSRGTLNRITWCNMQAMHYDDKEGYTKANDEILELFAKTTTLNTGFNFFRGKKQNGEIVDLYEIKYEVNNEY